MGVLCTFISAVADFQVDQVVELHRLQGVALHGCLQTPLRAKLLLCEPMGFTCIGTITALSAQLPRKDVLHTPAFARNFSSPNGLLPTACEASEVSVAGACSTEVGVRQIS